MMQDLSNWTARPRPAREPMEGRHVRLEPLDAAKHGDQLYEASSIVDAGERFRWLFEPPPESREAFQPWLDKAAASQDPLFFAVIDNDTLFFKVDDALRPRYQQRGMPAFAPIPGKPPMLGYFQVPVDVLEDAAVLCRWAAESVAINAAPRAARRRARMPLTRNQRAKR